MSWHDREAYERQFAQLAKQVPKGHVIHHCTWKDGRLTIMTAPRERAKPEPAEPKRARRGIAQEDLFSAGSH